MRILLREPDKFMLEKKISLSLGGTQGWTLGPIYVKHITGLTSSVPENYVKEERVCKKIVIVKYCFDTIKSAAKWNFEDFLMIIIQFNYSFIHFFSEMVSHVAQARLPLAL